MIRGVDSFVLALVRCGASRRRRTPQGAVLSPLLENVYFDSLNMPLEAMRLTMIRYRSSPFPMEEEEEKKQGNRDSPMVFYYEFELNVAPYGLVCDRRKERESRHLADVAETLVSVPPIQM